MSDKWTDASIFKAYRQAIQAHDWNEVRRIEGRYPDLSRELGEIKRAYKED